MNQRTDSTQQPAVVEKHEQTVEIPYHFGSSPNHLKNHNRWWITINAYRGHSSQLRENRQTKPCVRFCFVCFVSFLSLCFVSFRFVLVWFGFVGECSHECSYMPGHRNYASRLCFIVLSCVLAQADLPIYPISSSLRLSHGCLNSLWPSDAIWRHRSRLTLAQVMACCLTAPSHYLNQCWLIITKVQWCSSEGNFPWDITSIGR